MEGRRNIFDNAICLSVRKHSFGTGKKVKGDVIAQVIAAVAADRESQGLEPKETDPTLLRMTKKIYDSPAMDEIRNIYQAITHHLERYTVVNAMMKPGIYIVPIDHVVQVEEFIRRKIHDLEFFIYQLGEEYDRTVEEYMEKLGPWANRGDYPDVDKVKAKFHIDYEFLAMDVPQKLQYISASIWRQEREKAEQRIRVVSDRVENILLTSMQDLCTYLVERLTDNEGGKRKKFASDMLDNAREFFTAFRARNVTGAESLNDIADQGLRILEGVDLEALKDQAGMRENIRAQFAVITERMSGMIVTAPRRAINLQETVETPAPEIMSPQAQEELRNNFVEDVRNEVADQALLIMGGDDQSESHGGVGIVQAVHEALETHQDNNGDLFPF